MRESSSGDVVSEAQVLDYLRRAAQGVLELRPEQVAQLQMQTSLVDGLTLDSLKQVILMADIEESFGFQFSPDDLEHVRELETVADLVAFVRHRATAIPARA